MPGIFRHFAKYLITQFASNMYSVSEMFIFILSLYCNRLTSVGKAETA